MSNRKSIAIISFTLFLLILIGGIFTHELTRRLPSNVLLGNVSLEGMNRDQTLSLVKDEIQKLEQMTYQVTISDSLTKQFTSNEIGVLYQAEKTVNKIFDRTSWLIGVFAEPSQASDLSSFSFIPVVEIESSRYNASIEAYLLSQERDFNNAEVVWRDNAWLIKDAVPGIILKEMELARIKDAVIVSSYPFRESVQLVAEYEEVEPVLSVQDIAPLYEQVSQLSNQEILLIYDHDETIIKLNEDPNWLLIDQENQIVSFNRNFALTWVKQYAHSKDTPAGELTITEIEDVISEYDGVIYKKAIYEGDFTKGRNIKQAKIISDLEALFSDLSLENVIVVAWDNIEPIIISHVEGYEFPRILSTGVSSFRYGNTPNRVKNIGLSLGEFKGVVIDPGEEFSFNRATGWVTSRKGYTMTKIISEGKVTKGLGGGVCQSSTTVYRSILNAGLPVTERRNHSLDVIYYHEYGYGLDATVYTETRFDLKFVNDFPGPILINTYTDSDNNLAHVEFYGTTDDRVVELINIPTGNWLYKKWLWKIIWPDREEERTIQSRYFLPKEDEDESNPLEA